MVAINYYTITKKGNLKKCENYCTISLISHPSKVMIRVILNRLQPQVEAYLAEEQAVFRAGRSTTEQILNLRVLCEKYAEHNRALHNHFIDYRRLSTGSSMRDYGQLWGNTTSAADSQRS